MFTNLDFIAYWVLNNLSTRQPKKELELMKNVPMTIPVRVTEVVRALADDGLVELQPRGYVLTPKGEDERQQLLELMNKDK
jgi:predicted transcriptional regulator